MRLQRELRHLAPEPRAPQLAGGAMLGAFIISVSSANSLRKESGGGPAERLAMSRPGMAGGTLKEKSTTGLSGSRPVGLGFSFSWPATGVGGGGARASSAAGCFMMVSLGFVLLRDGFSWFRGGCVWLLEVVS